MTLENIEILNFKNIGSTKLDFSPGVNCLLGMNGMGKSNLLDAIHLLSLARTITSLPDSAIVRHNEEMMLVKGVFLNESGASDTISCGIAKGKRKSLKRNGKEYGRLSEHVGNYPVVVSTPDDHKIISGGGDERRKLMDMVISQADAEYLAALIRYNRALENRNKMLRAGVKDTILYESIENTLIESSSIIHPRRKEWVAEISPIVQQLYAGISGDREEIKLGYKSALNNSSMKDVLESHRAKDQVLGFTSAGTHRDDLESWLNGHNLRALGSQGQLKTFVVALRLAIFRYLKQKKNVTPLLLLDDIFDKLDSQRVANIMKEVTNADQYGQIFITDTNRKHLDDILQGITGAKTLIFVENGEFNPTDPDTQDNIAPINQM